MAYFRTDTGSLHTGLKIETIEGTAETLTATEFVGDWKASLMQPKATVQKIEVGGSIGTDKMITTKLYGELNSFKMPVVSGNDGLFLKICGAYATPNASPVSTDYQFGGSIYSGMAAANKGRITDKSLTIAQYDGKELYTMSGARPYSLKIGAKANEIVYMDASFQGSFTKSNAAIAFYQTPITSMLLNSLTGSVLSIDGQVYDYSEIEIDIKPTLKIVESAANSKGVAQFEITDLDPTIVLSLYPLDPAVKDLWALLLTNNPVAFSWTMGGAAQGLNSYVWTANVQCESQEASYDNNIQVRKIVLKPVFNSANNYKLRLRQS